MENVTVSLEKAEATFDLKPGIKLRPDTLGKIVADAGFTPRNFFITSRGKLIEKDGKLAFQPIGSPQTFSLVPNEKLTQLGVEGLKEVGLVAKVVGVKPPLSLEIKDYNK